MNPLRVILVVLAITEMNGAFEVGMMYGILATLDPRTLIERRPEAVAQSYAGSIG